MSFKNSLWLPLTTIFLFGNLNFVLAIGLDKQESCDILCGGPAILRPGPSYRFGIGGDPNELGTQGWNHINQIATNTLFCFLGQCAQGPAAQIGQGVGQQVGNGVGGLVGSQGGTAVGSAVGSVIGGPGLGTLIGSGIFGSLGGSIGSQIGGGGLGALGNGFGKWVDGFFVPQGRSFRARALRRRGGLSGRSCSDGKGNCEW